MRSFPDRWIPLAGLAVLILAAWFSTGFQSADEHYQVIAFAEAKLGHQAVGTLPWEYAAQIRSAFLPAICMAVFSAAHSIGVEDPFLLTFLLRLLTALLAFGTVLTFVRAARPTVRPELQRAFLLLSFFLWFLPFLHVRFTGETWSGFFLLLAMAQLLGSSARRWRLARCGLFLGLAFLCRPPSLAAAIGIMGWLVLVKREALLHLLQLVAVFALVLLGGIAMDSWFYGQFTATAWNYMRLGMMGSADHPFTEFPWWYYYAWVFKYSIPLFGAIILLAFGLLCAFKPRHLLTWAIVPFLLLHMALPHKELRFLLPLADLVPLLLITAIPLFKAQWPRMAHLLQGRMGKPSVALLAGINLIALCAVSFTPAGSGRTRLAAYIKDHYPARTVNINYLANDTNVWDIRIPEFYLHKGISNSIAGTPCIHLAEASGPVQLLVAQGSADFLPQCPDRQWTEVASAQPAWKEWLLKGYDLEDAKPGWKLYEGITLAAPAPE